jgi:cytoskeleton protein RodZ
MTMSLQTEASAAPQRGNPGEVLRLAREKKGWQVAEVATQLNLTAQSLAQLEAGEFDRLPGHTFARGYVRAYAKLLGLEQAGLVEQFDRFTGTDATGSTVQSLGRLPEPLRLSRLVLRLASAVLLLLLLALAYFWWQERPERLADLGSLGIKHIEVESADGSTEIHPLDEPEDQAVADAQKTNEASGETALVLPGQTPVTSESAAVPAAANPPVTQASVPAAPLVAQPAVVAPVPAQAATPAPTVAQVATPASVPAEQPPVSAAEGEGVVQISFGAECWTQVTDAKGRVLVSVVKHKGDTLQVVGKAPLDLRLGFARAAQVTYNGAPVSLGNVTSGGTARVKLGQ